MGVHISVVRQHPFKLLTTLKRHNNNVMLYLSIYIGTGRKGDVVQSNILVLKVAFIQKGLVNLIFLQTDEPNYFPELKF